MCSLPQKMFGASSPARSPSASRCPPPTKCHEASTAHPRPDLRSPYPQLGHYPPPANREAISRLRPQLSGLSPRSISPPAQTFPTAPRSSPAGLVPLPLSAASSALQYGSRGASHPTPAYVARLGRPRASPAARPHSSPGLPPTRPLSATTASFGGRSTPA